METWDETLRQQKLLARPLCAGLQLLNEVAKFRKFSESDLELLENGFAAYMYEEGSTFSGKNLLMMTLAGLYGPRVAERVDEMRKARVQASQVPVLHRGGVGVVTTPPSEAVVSQ